MAHSFVERRYFSLPGMQPFAAISSQKGKLWRAAKGHEMCRVTSGANTDVWKPSSVSS